MMASARVTAYRAFRSRLYVTSVMPVGKSMIASIFSRISRGRCAGQLEDIHGFALNRLPEQGVDGVPVDNIHGGTDEVGDRAREAGIGEQAEQMSRIQLNEDVGITIRTGVAPRDRPEDGNDTSHLEGQRGRLSPLCATSSPPYTRVRSHQKK
jgi:hypothetical protein